MKASKHIMPGTILFGLLVSLAVLVIPQKAIASDCGKVVKVVTHDDTTTRYVLARSKVSKSGKDHITLVLLAGGGGHIDLDDEGCPQALKGNSLIRSLPLFHQAGFTTALVDAPSDYTGKAGLAGFRIDPVHAADLGRVITDVRSRSKGKIWLIGTSRGTISAVNAAALNQTGTSAIDGLVLTSAVTSGFSGGMKEWVAQTVFDLPLEAIKIPVLVVGHAEDLCARTPPGLMDSIIERTKGTREQVVTATGGPGLSGGVSVKACRGRAPHGFVDQLDEVVAGITRFIKGGKY